jgi:hypothetical protein
MDGFRGELTMRGQASYVTKNHIEQNGKAEQAMAERNGD